MSVEISELVYLAPVVFGLFGLLVLWQVREPYRRLGGGGLSLDVSDRSDSAPLHSAAGQAELAQLRAAVAYVREERSSGREADSAQETGGPEWD